MNGFDDCINCILNTDSVNTEQLTLTNSAISVLNVYYTGDLYPEIFQLLTQNQVKNVQIMVGWDGMITNIDLVE